MNFSIIVPGECNAKCEFCFMKDTGEVSDNYLEELDQLLNSFPKGHSLSLTGGEPTISLYFADVLELVKKYKHKFTKVVLTTNGTNMDFCLDGIETR